MSTVSIRSLSAASLVSVAILSSACSATEKAPGPDSASRAVAGTPAPACPASDARLTLPAGFCATVFAESISNGRHVVVAANGDVYVTVEGTRKPAPGAPAAPAVSFVALRDSNRDGKADIIQRAGRLGNTGIGLANGHLYVDEGTRIVRYARPDTQLVPAAKAEVIVSGLPLLPGHRARNFVIGPDSSLYVNVGSATNSCQVKDRGNESPGIDPCVELLTRAGTWRFSAVKQNQSFSPSARFASGIRNGMGLAVANDGKLYQTQHGRDQLNANWPKLFPTTKYSAENPAEELLQVNENDEFGWPYCYFSLDEKKLVTAPEYGGDGKKDDRCTSKKQPAATFPAHWAPMSLLFYSGSAFPARYKDGVFISFHGSWNRAPEPQEGYRVVFQPMTNGAAGGTYETFADGFADVPKEQVQPGSAKHRPMGLATAPDGSLYITDDAGGRIYRITYSGAK